MPSVSDAQKKAACAAKAAKGHPGKLKKLRGSSKQMAKMTSAQLRKFCETPGELPKKKTTKEAFEEFRSILINHVGDAFDAIVESDEELRRDYALNQRTKDLFKLAYPSLRSDIEKKEQSGKTTVDLPRPRKADKTPLVDDVQKIYEIAIKNLTPDELDRVINLLKIIKQDPVAAKKAYSTKSESYTFDIGGNMVAEDASTEFDLIKCAENELARRKITAPEGLNGDRLVETIDAKVRNLKVSGGDTTTCQKCGGNTTAGQKCLKCFPAGKYKGKANAEPAGRAAKGGEPMSEVSPSGKKMCMCGGDDGGKGCKTPDCPNYVNGHSEEPKQSGKTAATRSHSRCKPTKADSEEQDTAKMEDRSLDKKFKIITESAKGRYTRRMARLCEVASGNRILTEGEWKDRIGDDNMKLATQMGVLQPLMEQPMPPNAGEDNIVGPPGFKGAVPSPEAGLDDQEGEESGDELETKPEDTEEIEEIEEVDEDLITKDEVMKIFNALKVKADDGAKAMIDKALEDEMPEGLDGAEGGEEGEDGMPDGLPEELKDEGEEGEEGEEEESEEGEEDKEKGGKPF